MATSTAEITCKAEELVSYAMAHNEIRVVHELVLRAPVIESTSATVTIEISDVHGVVTQPFSRDVELDPDRPTVLTEPALLLDPGQMLQVEEQRPAVLRVRLVNGDELLGVHEQPVRLLAAYQWLRRPALLSMELLAAFVVPNDPAVALLVSEASNLLRARTGSASLEGYQSGPERVDDIVRAVYEAMQARNIRYSEPPASWADQGQKVRTPEQVLDGRVGTCLDTTVVMAAALEQCGVRPLVWLLDGHAFVGYWRVERALDAIVQTESAELVNYIDLGLMQVVETTALTERQEAVAFADACRSPYRTYLSGDLADVLAVTDVWAARQQDLLPLPARRRTEQGDMQVIEYRPAEHSSAPEVVVSGRDRAPRPSDVPPRVQQWKNALLDLSLRNKLINFSERNSIRLVVPAGGLGQLEDLVNADKAITLLPADQVDQVHVARQITSGSQLPQATLLDLLNRQKTVYSDVSAAAYPTRLRGLAYKAKTIVEETGANNLYLALGSLLWDLDGKALRSPLVLVPVSLVAAARGRAYRVAMDDSGTSTPNYCLLEKLRQVHGLEIPGLADPVEDESGIDLDAALQAVRVVIAEQGLPYRVDPTADLAILQFAKFRLWKDLDESWQTLLTNPLVNHLVQSPHLPFQDPAAARGEPADLDALDAQCPVPADASQLEAVADAVAGRTFVLEGPPGTGKSQTITNLLTRAVAEGRRVLFVAEKRAALDVVRARLDSVGIAPFCLDLHDKASKPIAVRAQIKQALEHAVDVDQQGYDSDREELRSATRSLARYTRRLHEPNAAQLSLYGAHTQLLTLGDQAELPVPATLLASTAAALIANVRHTCQTLPETADPAHPSEQHAWGFVDQGDLDADTTAAAAGRVDQAIRQVEVPGPLREVLAAVQTPAQLSALNGLLGTEISLQVLDDTRSATWQRASTALAQEVNAFVAAAHPGLDVATPAALELPLADLHAAALAAASSGFFGRKKRLKAVLEQLRPALRPDADVAPKRLPELTGALLQVQGAVTALATHAASVPGVEVPATWNPLTPDGQQLVERQVGWLSWAGAAVEASSAAAQSFPEALRRYLSAPHPVDPGVRTALGELVDALAALNRQCSSAPAWTRWASSVGLLEQWRRSRATGTVADAGSLRRWLPFVQALEPLRAAGLDHGRDLLLQGSIDAGDAKRAFERGLAQASLAERLVTTGLDAFDSAAHDRTVERFSRASSSVRGHLVTAVPEEVLAARPFRVDTASGQVGALRRELSRQRGGRGVRSLMDGYGELITQVLPCVLVSPDSVARFFPVRQGLFDLVVFDEASQIRVADAVGAIGRSGSVVVVGDSKQMPPSSFGEADLEDDTDSGETTVVQDEESILTECVQARVLQRLLSWHYRSADESLIAFSNGRYYDGRLSSFPAPTHGTADPGLHGHGITLRRVDGQFHRTGKGKLLRTNPVEAEAVVEEIRRRFQDSPDKVPSVGVVTFNQQQRAYIEGLIRDSADERLIEALDGTGGEGLFIKNLENVQGDERDVILFSTAFSVNDKGQLPLNFGPLNRGGGERRLNVAITRARRQVIVFSSFDPGQLRADETSSIGIKHLRAYLDTAAGAGTTDEPTRARSARVADRHLREIADTLRQRGLVVQTDVGLSEFKVDLSVALPDAPDRPVMAVLLDGPGWAARRTTGDRDGLPRQVLENLMGWPAVQRVWLPAWLADPGAVTEQVVAAAKAVSGVADRRDAALDSEVETSSPFALVGGVLKMRGGTRRAAPASAASDSVALGARTPAAVVAASTAPTRSGPGPALAGEKPFRPWPMPTSGTKEVLDQLPAHPAARRVAAALAAAVSVEGPVQLDRLARLVAASFGLSRVSAARSDAILRELPAGLRPDRSQPFAWPEHRSATSWTGFRRATEADPRPLEQIHPREIGNAMVALCAASVGMAREELMREALACFGGRRLTPAVTARLEEAVQDAVSCGRLAERDGYYMVS